MEKWKEKRKRKRRDLLGKMCAQKIRDGAGRNSLFFEISLSSSGSRLPALF